MFVVVLPETPNGLFDVSAPELGPGELERSEENKIHLVSIGYTREASEVGSLWLCQHDVVPPGAILQDKNGLDEDPTTGYYWFMQQRWRSNVQLSSYGWLCDRDEEEDADVERGGGRLTAGL